MMSIAMLKEYTDVLSRTYQRLLATTGLSTDALPDTTSRGDSERLFVIVRDDSDDYYIEKEFNKAVYDMQNAIGADSIFTRLFVPTLTVLDSHYGLHGSDVDSTITSLQTMLAYYNGGTGGLKFANMLDPYFNDLMYGTNGGTRPLLNTYYYQPCIHPQFGSSANGMGKKEIGSVFAAGDDYDSNYAEVVPILEVTTDFTGGGAVPSYTVAGTDDTGATSTTWTGSFTGNNPIDTVVSATIVDAISTRGRQTVTLTSTTNVVAGSVLIINLGMIDHEVIIVEAVVGVTITAVFLKTHDAGAAIFYWSSCALTPSVANRRLRSVSSITLGAGTHITGGVRVIGRQDRVAY